MIRTDLPMLTLHNLSGGPAIMVLCATARLAAGLRQAHGLAQSATGVTSWLALQTATVAQWLDHLTSAALLRGEIPAAGVPGTFLTWPQERSVWEQAVAGDTADRQHGVAELFDRDGMALAAMEAESYRRAWRIEVPEALHTEEYRAFLRWREQVEALCQRNGWTTADAALAWRLDCLTRGLGGLPERVGIAGFTVPEPLISRLLTLLEARGVSLFRVDFGARNPAPTVNAVEIADAEAECEAVGVWAREALARDPGARLRIGVADLPARRRALEAALAAALHPDSVGAGWTGQPPGYVFSAGSPLASEPFVEVALRLLQLFAHPQQVAQADFGALLCGMGWSADVDEADGRARLEAALREALPPEATLERVNRAVGRLAQAVDAAQLSKHVMALIEQVRAAPRRQTPGLWGRAFADVLTAVNWPGQRPLLPVEHAACDLLQEAMRGLAGLDAVLGRIDVGTALRQLVRQCKDHAFVPTRQRPASIEIVSLADAVGGPVDGLWLMGMNEGAWPPAPRPNPLLPAEAQRHAGVPTARADSLAAQAQRVQALWCASADSVTFSWPGRDGERVLRPSALLAGVERLGAEGATFSAEGVRGHLTGSSPFKGEVRRGMGVEGVEAEHSPIPTPALPLKGREKIAASSSLERIHDARAPDVLPEERIRGGTWLLQAQAVCPAWGFYQYRLGGKALPIPVFGLDARARGTLLHAALEAFWRGGSWARLHAMSAETLFAEIGRVVAHALDAFDQRAVDPLPPRLRALEGERLAALVATWLEIEAQRSPFSVLACEERHELVIAGLPVRVVIDRVDELEDGRLVIIDYKTGKSATVESWAAARISEPQLPIYAALVFPDSPLAAVGLARVLSHDAGFVGVAESDEALPGVKSLAEQRKRYPEEAFADWDAVRRHWAERITELAREVRDGCAAVVFDSEKDLTHCDVRPLLRVAERRAQWDAGR